MTPTWSWSFDSGKEVPDTQETQKNGRCEAHSVTRHIWWSYLKKMMEKLEVKPEFSAAGGRTMKSDFGCEFNFSRLSLSDSAVLEDSCRLLSMVYTSLDPIQGLGTKQTDGNVHNFVEEVLKTNHCDWQCDSLLMRTWRRGYHTKCTDPHHHTQTNDHFF